MATILVVEDDIFIGMDSVFILEELGHETLFADDVDKAIEIVRSPSRIDALFTDIRLKSRVHGGYELAHLAVGLRPGLRVLYTTGGQRADLSTGLVLAGSHFLQKPYSEDQLGVSIGAVLGALH